MSENIVPEFVGWEAAAAAFVKSEKRLILFFEITLSAALLYGINLYFSSNGSINNPVVPIWLPVIKDALFLVAFTLFFRLAGLPSPTLPLVLVFVFSALCSLWSLADFGISTASISFSKNLLIYFAGGAALGASIARFSSPQRIATAIIRSVVLSVLVGILCLWLPVHSNDDRLYGTYGNPTSMGFAVFVAFALSAALRPGYETMALSALLGLVYVMTGSISVLLAAIAFLTILATLEAWHKRSTRLQLSYVLILVASIAVTGPIMNALGWPSFGFDRLIAIENTLSQSDSITVRIAEFYFSADGIYTRYDSFLLSIYKNFGIVPLIAYAGMIATLVLAWLRSSQTTEQNAAAACIFCLFVLNPMLQHQMEIFPTNLLFGIYLGYSARCLNNVT